mmetsp:Transcript_40841/g.89345  ORF Transcript_40841/g.89345 Transcript_40841/m.89345 type:complete len:454 (-) Transcript_40841:261-1622(-)
MNGVGSDWDGQWTPPFLLHHVFSYVSIGFIDVLVSVNLAWKALGRDPSWKPELLLYSWGSGNCTGHGEGRLAQPRLLQRFCSPLPQDQIVSIACSDFVTMALTADGQVYEWGYRCTDERVLFPQRIQAFEGYRIERVRVSCPGYYHNRNNSTQMHHAAALADDGTFWMWGFDGSGQLFLDRRPNEVVELFLDRRQSEVVVAEPRKVKYFADRGERVKDFSCGVIHTAVHTEDNDMVRRTHQAVEWSQRELTELTGVTLKSLSCGGFHACAIDDEDRLWTWGSVKGYDISNGNLLGRGREHYGKNFERSRLPPSRMNNFTQPVREVATSSYTTAVLTMDGKVYSWGDSDGAALGHSAHPCHEPQQVALPQNADVSHVSLAYTNGAVATTSGQLIMWGGRSWDRGLSEEVTQQSEGRPREVPWSGMARDYQCDSVALGHNHAFILARKSLKSSQR